MDRKVIRCPHCQLNQFETASGNCRKCDEPFAVPVVEVEPEPPAAPRRIRRTDTAVANVPKVLTVLRVAIGFSQARLALRIHTPRSYVSKIENGRCLPTLYKLYEITEALGVTMGQFVRMLEAWEDAPTRTTCSCGANLRFVGNSYYMADDGSTCHAKRLYDDDGSPRGAELEVHSP